MAERDYLLGTHDEELERLGLQHRVWRPRVLDAWRRAGITTGMRIVDAGAGPGWATIDLAEIVGPDGRVHALERSQRFLAALEEAADLRGLNNIEAHELDLTTDPLPVEEWTRSGCAGCSPFWPTRPRWCASSRRRSSPAAWR